MFDSRASATSSLLKRQLRAFLTRDYPLWPKASNNTLAYHFQNLTDSRLYRFKSVTMTITIAYWRNPSITFRYISYSNFLPLTRTHCAALVPDILSLFLAVISAILPIWLAALL